MKEFNTTAVCIPSKHYMADISERVAKIKQLVEAGKYFAINRARQYGKTTTLEALSVSLKEEYIVISLDFQDISDGTFKKEGTFVQGMARMICDLADFVDVPIPNTYYEEFALLNKRDEDKVKLDELFRVLCVGSRKQKSQLYWL